MTSEADASKCDETAYVDEHDCDSSFGENVSHPSHYQSEGVECIDAMYAVSPDMAVYFSVGSALKYLDRAGLKVDEGEDLRKAKECWHMAKRMLARKIREDVSA